MPTAIDSEILGPLFRDETVAELFSDQACVRAMAEVEAALARAEAKAGVIPDSAAEEISAAVRSANVDLQQIADGTSRDGFPVIALVQALRQAAGPKAAPYLHWGATTQDIVDTAFVLQCRSAIGLFKERLAEIARSLARLAERHRSTVMAGRTHSQQALPVTFGFKAASWLAPLIRHRERLDQLCLRLLTVQFGGASGTLAALGDKGLSVMRGLADDLGLAVPVMPWHTQRDGFVELAGWLSLLTGSLAKMAQDIILMAQTEVDEAVESAESGRGGSSTMPQKSNPITSELIVAAARTNAALLSAMHQASIQEHERGTHGWQVEWLTLPQMILLSSGALKHALYLAEHLRVSENKMRENLARANDLVLAEAVSFALAAHMPRDKAHQLVKAACAAAVSEGKGVVEVARGLARDAVPDGAIDWNALADPANYLGETDRIIDRVLESARKVLA